jgi:hypothetical protein
MSQRVPFRGNFYLLPEQMLCGEFSLSLYVPANDKSSTKDLFFQHIYNRNIF